MEIFTYEGFVALMQVIGIDLVLAGDNAIVIGLAAAGLPAEQRNKAVVIGILAATLLRIGFAAVTVRADHDPASRHRRAAAGGGYPLAVGLLEDVAGTARRGA